MITPACFVMEAKSRLSSREVQSTKWAGLRASLPSRVSAASMIIFIELVLPELHQQRLDGVRSDIKVQPGVWRAGIAPHHNQPLQRALHEVATPHGGHRAVQLDYCIAGQAKRVPEPYHQPRAVMPGPKGEQHQPVREPDRPPAPELLILDFGFWILDWA